MTTLDRDWLLEYPAPLIKALADISMLTHCQLFISGGAVRDWLFGNVSNDLDVTVAGDALFFAEKFAEALAAAYVLLDEKERVARVVWRDHVVDFSSFREASKTILEDLSKRDFTMNALAVAFDENKAGLKPPCKIIDPTGGTQDISDKVIRVTSDAVFDKDPLRLLRVYRFKATLGFGIDAETDSLVAQKALLLSGAASERISHELEKIISTENAAAVFSVMAKNDLLWVVFPELHAGVGLEQPDSHHLDVFSHSLEALAKMESLLQSPAKFFPNHQEQMTTYINKERNRVWLKWAALFHDLGKSEACRIRDSRITFYNHDKIGARIFESIARRLRWSREDRKQVARFIDLHMWTFHLSNVMRKKEVTPKACLRLVKAAGEHFPGVFLVAMADSLAGQGEGKPAGVESFLAALYEKVDRVYHESIKPVLEQPRLLTGKDLIDEFGLDPGPLFRDIFAELEQAQVAGEVKTRDQAKKRVEFFLAQQKDQYLV